MLKRKTYGERQDDGKILGSELRPIVGYEKSGKHG
jgi:hypothetical protein